MTWLGGALVCVVGIVMMSMVSSAIDQSLGVKVSGSTPARIIHVILGMTKGAFLMWLMSVTVFSTP